MTQDLPKELHDDGPLFVLPEEECFRLLARGHFGRAGLVEDDRAVILPVNYVFGEGCVVFQSTAGSKLEAALAGRSVAFEIDAVDPTRSTRCTTAGSACSRTGGRKSSTRRKTSNASRSYHSVHGGRMHVTGGFASASRKSPDGGSAPRSPGNYCTMKAVTIPNIIPFSCSAWLRMWQWYAHTPFWSAVGLTSTV